MMLKDGTCVSVRPPSLRSRPVLCVSPFAHALIALVFSATVGRRWRIHPLGLGAWTFAPRTRRCPRSAAVAF